eukprot:TRINITY_DN32097_c0_g1_i1.p1 TRINITY_DN32097_c0_g1~~TRINITY_DN32097_c0_g1_i1.p1  ORF type:complete len:540 (+),score=133.53 TRINITY_DN32097_c0_g1_i1:103-1722(+)
MEEITEGGAKVLFKRGEVFYNPVMCFNRDISVLAIRVYDQIRQSENREKAEKKRKLNPGNDPSKYDYIEDQPLHILEGLAATGLRSIRFAREIPGVGSILVNDLEEAAVESIRRNVEHNGVSSTCVPSQGDFNVVALQQTGKYHIIDLDPYGSPAGLLESAVKSIPDGGMLCVTATDLSVLCGNNPETCYGKYGSTPLRQPYCHEMALRILLYTISMAAARQRKAIRPLVSLSVDFYVRVFVRVFDSAQESKEVFLKHGMICQSVNVPSFSTQPIGRSHPKKKSFLPAHCEISPSCPQTGGRCVLGGPLWIDSLHDREFVVQMMEELDRMQAAATKDAEDGSPSAIPLLFTSRIRGILTTVLEELDTVLFHHLPTMAKVLHCCVPPSDSFRSALFRLGYKVSLTHCSKDGLKTDAGDAVIWDLMKVWAKRDRAAAVEGKRVKKGREESPATLVMSHPVTTFNEEDVDFSVVVKEAQQMGRKGTGVARFLPNPRERWGPGTRARGSKAGTEILSTTVGTSDDESPQSEPEPPVEKKRKTQ